MPFHDWTRVYSGLLHDFHQSWSIRIKDALNAGLLPAGITALVEHRARPKELDVVTADSFFYGNRRDDGFGELTWEPPVTRVVRQSEKEVYSQLANRIVVQQQLGQTIAVIEIVSPGNKDSKRAFKAFREKSVAFISSGIHLLVIDLFPPTKRDPFGVHQEIWDEFEDEDETFHFPPGTDRILASYNAGHVKTAYVEPITVGDTMPDMPLFLFDDRYIKVPLEATYQTTWSVFPRNLQTIVETGIMPIFEK